MYPKEYRSDGGIELALAHRLKCWASVAALCGSANNYLVIH